MLRLFIFGSAFSWCWLCYRCVCRRVENSDNTNKPTSGRSTENEGAQIKKCKLTKGFKAKIHKLALGVA